MDEVRCPMCSKPNPIDAEECEFCGARIKPLIIQQEPDETSQHEKQPPGAPSEQPSDEPRAETDWLKRIRFGVEGEELDEQDLAEDTSDPKRGETDLLGRFRDLGISEDDQEAFLRESPISEGSEPEVQDETPEFQPPLDLEQRLSVPEQEIDIGTDLPETEQEPVTGLPSLEDMFPEISSREPEGKPDSDAEVVPDWLARIRVRKEIEQAHQPAKTGDTDWLSGLREVSLTGDKPEPDILGSEQDGFPPEPTDTIEENLEPLQPEGTLGEDLLAEEPVELEPSLTSVEDLISELDMLSLDESEQRVGDDLLQDEPVELEVSTTSMDDLISELDALSSEEPEAKTQEDLPLDLGSPSSEVDDDLLLEDLFADMDLPSTEQKKAVFDDEFFAEFESLEDKTSEGIIPDDLFADFVVSPSEKDQEAPISDVFGESKDGKREQEDKLLDADFFADLGLDVAAEVKKPLEDEPALDFPESSDEALPLEEAFLAEEILPDEEIHPADDNFLADLIQDSSQFQDFAPGSDRLAKEPDLDDISDLSAELPGVPLSEASQDKSPLGDILSDFSPSWLDETVASDSDEFPHVPALILDDELPLYEGVGAEGDATSVEIPSWLQDLGKDVEEDLVDGDEALPVLVKATLPPWLEAMRPLETFRAPPEIELEEEEEIIEAAGPLAGLKGVLLAEPVVAMPRTPVISVGSLDISDRDYNQAKILQQMVEEEQRDEEGIVTKRAPFPIIRWISAGLLVLGVTIPSLLGFPKFRSPTRAPIELSPFLEIVRTLPADIPSLLVFDYEPSHSAEMDAVAGALVENLMAQGQPLITLSTQLSGPLLADRMVRRVGNVHDAKNGEDYLHLGYLSGGSTAIQLFAASPSESLALGFKLPEEFEGEDAWDSPLLDNIRQLSDFAMVAVISSGTESARNWAEQVQPLMGNSPLVMVLSAGTEPIIRPYYEAENGQVDGILSGLPSAMIYEGVNGLQADATHRWNGYGTSVLIAVMILLAGAGYSAVTWILKRFSSRES